MTYEHYFDSVLRYVGLEAADKKIANIIKKCFGLNYSMPHAILCVKNYLVTK